MNVILLILLVVCSAISHAALPPERKESACTVVSPDGRLKLVFTVGSDGHPTYSFAADGRELINPSRLGWARDGASSPATLTIVSRRTVDTVWKPVWGKRASVPERFNEATLDLNNFSLVARAYDDGVAFRYETASTNATAELTRYNFAGDYTAWFYNGEHANLGPEKLSAVNGRRLPVMTIKVDDHCYLALHEADLSAGDPLVLESKAGATSFGVASKPSSAWRVILHGRSAGALVDSHLIELLNPPPAAGMAFDWVKPGVGVWDWRINGAQVNGFKYDMSLPSWQRMVDFAAENQLAWLILDADWYGPEFGKASDPTKGGKVAQVHEIITYGKARGVGIWLYLNDVAGREYPLEQTLRQYGAWGAAGVKYGFMNGSPAEKNRRTQRITELCAQNRLLCDFHDGPVHPYGQLRTWPNAVTREYCHSQLDAHRVFNPGTFVTAVYVNMLAGPLDMCNGLADLTQAGRVDQPSPVPSTLVGEAARTLIVFSGAVILPDIPENYRKHPELLQFIAAEKMPWRDSHTLSGEIGQYIVVARQSVAGIWLVGAATNEEARQLDVSLTFLGPGQWEAVILQDGVDADYRTHRESYQVDRRTVTAADKIQLQLAPGGGAGLILKPAR